MYAVGEQNPPCTTLNRDEYRVDDHLLSREW